MTQLIVPLQPVPSQRLSTVLDGQIVAISVYQLRYGLFVDVYLNGNAVVIGVIAQDMNRIVRDSYHGFAGDFVFKDTQGSDDPDYTGLGSRFLFVYLSAADAHLA